MSSQPDGQLPVVPCYLEFFAPGDPPSPRPDAEEISALWHEQLERTLLARQQLIDRRPLHPFAHQVHLDQVLTCRLG